MKTKQQFIIDTLLPYFKDKTNCAINENGGCLYLTEDGRKCAVGKHLKKGKWQKHEGNIHSLLEDYKKEDIFKKSALEQDISLDGWKLMQIIHDSFATIDSSKESTNRRLTNLERIEQVDLSKLKAYL